MEIKFADRLSGVKASAIREIFKATADKEIQRISDEILKKDPISVLQYGITEGDPGLIKAASGFFNAHEQVVSEHDKMIITSGSQQIMEFMAKTLCNEGDVILSENPSFLGALNSFKSLGAVVKGIEYKNNVLDLEALEKELQSPKKPKFIYLIPNFQNPTGLTMPLDIRRKVLELAKKYQVLILEDNPYGDLRFEGEHVPSIKSLDDEGYVVYAASLSKIIAPGMRVACCIGPKALVEKFVICKQGSDVHTNLWAQKVMAQFINEVDMDEHIARISEIYKNKCELMLNRMKEQVHPDVLFTKPSGGMFIWVTLPDCIDMQLFVKEAIKNNVAVVPGNAFLDDDRKECHCFRMNFSTPSDEKIVEGVRILGKLTYDMRESK